jgi:Ca-activated chloride channel homolog
MMTFDAPFVLLIAPLVGGVVWFAALWARRTRLARAGQWSDDALRAARDAGRFAPTALCLAAFCGTAALAGPRWGSEHVTAEARGLDVVLAVDISRSMLAEDAGSARLARAVREARRLVQDQSGSRVGLVAFAGAAYVLSPLTVDGSAITMYLDALDPDMASAGGTALGPALQTGGALLDAATDGSDRVLVIFTDGEAHDTLPDALRQATQLGQNGIHVILVAEGGKTPVRIPMRDDHGTLLGWQRDGDSAVIGTARRDDILSAVADAAQGAVVAAELPDQAGAVRDLLVAYKRTRGAETHVARGRSQAWIAVLIGVALLLGQAATRRAASLIMLLVMVGGVSRLLGQGPSSPRPRAPAKKAWDRGDTLGARAAYLLALAHGRGSDTAWYNAGTAALAAGDWETAQQGLSRAATSLDPEVRFRALYNLGLAGLRLARADSARRDAHLADAEKSYREALLLKPGQLAAKWNLELATRRRGSGGSNAPNQPPAGGGGGGAGNGENGGGRAGGGAPQGRTLSPGQADEILRSIGQEELRTRRDRAGRTRRAVEPDVKNW